MMMTEAVPSVPSATAKIHPPEVETAEITIGSCDDATDGDYTLLNICDVAGGIPQEVLMRMGKELVSTKGEKGTGLGFQIVVETLTRLQGSVIIATLTVPTPEFAAGTIISLKLPKVVRKTAPRESLIIASDPRKHFEVVYRSIPEMAD
jgi:sensor histidine kinase regulating citrate/malate metabolism